MRVLAVSGSLRHDSANTRLLRALTEDAPAEVEIELWEGLRSVPPYDQDIDGDDVDRHVRVYRHGAEMFKHAVAGADAVIFSTPEYNSSIPGALKNALDWASRPLATNPFRNKPVAVVGASAGMFGAVWAQAELRKVLGAMGARVVGGDVPVGHALERFDEAGRLDDEVREQLLAQLELLVEETDRSRAMAAEAAA